MLKDVETLILRVQRDPPRLERSIAPGRRSIQPILNDQKGGSALPDRACISYVGRERIRARGGTTTATSCRSGSVERGDLLVGAGLEGERVRAGRGREEDDERDEGGQDANHLEWWSGVGGRGREEKSGRGGPQGNGGTLDAQGIPSASACLYLCPSDCGKGPPVDAWETGEYRFCPRCARTITHHRSAHWTPTATSILIFPSPHDPMFPCCYVVMVSLHSAASMIRREGNVVLINEWRPFYSSSIKIYVSLRIKSDPQPAGGRPRFSQTRAGGAHRTKHDGLLQYSYSTRAVAFFPPLPPLFS